MTLKEYKNQKDPVRMPTVCLQKGEYTLGHKIAPRFRDSRQSVWVKGFPSEYCMVNDYPRLYTTDRDGNPKERSVFVIN